MKVTGFLILFFLNSIFFNALPGILSAQQMSPIAIAGTDVLLFTTDFSGNIYTWSKHHDIAKFNASGEQLFRNNFSMQGAPSTIDVRNPMLTLLYYPEYLMIRMLDRTLSQLAEINLGDWGYIEVPCIAASNDNQLWIYDQSANKILKLNMQGQVLTSSPDLMQWTGLPLHPVKLKERNNQLFLLDESHGLLILDLYAQPEQLLTSYDIVDFQIHDGTLFLLHDTADRQGGQKMLSKKELLTLTTTPYKTDFPLFEASQFRIEKQHFYLLQAGKVYVYAR